MGGLGGSRSLFGRRSVPRGKSLVQGGQHLRQRFESEPVAFDKLKVGDMLVTPEGLCRVTHVGDKGATVRPVGQGVAGEPIRVGRGHQLTRAVRPGGQPVERLPGSERRRIPVAADDPAEQGPPPKGAKSGGEQEQEPVG